MPKLKRKKPKTRKPAPPQFEGWHQSEHGWFRGEGSVKLMVEQKPGSDQGFVTVKVEPISVMIECDPADLEFSTGEASQMILDYIAKELGLHVSH